MQEIKAIETEYAGCRFRSRLEARWAVFFDALGVKWQYGPQGFELPSGDRYLPDFHLPEQTLWVEVKGPEDELRAEQAKYAEAAMMLDGYGLMFLGPIPDLRLGMPQHFVVKREEHCCGETVLCLHMAWGEMLHERRAVSEIGLPCCDLISHVPGKLPPLKGYNLQRARYNDPGPVEDWPIIEPVEKAYRSARSARFEHGERG